jgi:hypothetical protein
MDHHLTAHIPRVSLKNNKEKKCLENEMKGQPKRQPLKKNQPKA